MNRKYILVFVLFAFIQKVAVAQTPDWSTSVAPIIYNHCSGCHHSGSIAPFALMSYQDAVTEAPSILHDVQNRIMPPWPPDPSYKHLAHERILSQQEINTIVSWVNNGTPQGNISLAPPPPTFSTNGLLPGTPDYIGQIPTFTSPAGVGQDVYQCFVIPHTDSIDRYITAFEAVPGNAGIVHHVLVFADTTGICRRLDSLSPGPGYLNFGGVGTDSAVLIGGWVPGSAPLVYPSPFGVKLPHNADIVLQIHYPANTIGKKDSTQVHFFFSSSNTGMRDLYIAPVLNYFDNINAPLYIPANTTRSFNETFTTPFSFSLLGIAPHMHLIGKSIQVYGINAGDTQNYIKVNNWDFHWQGFYLFPKIVKVAASTLVRADAFYDNTTSNPSNPNLPPQDVYAGESTTNEMMLVFFVFTLYAPGDENIVIDSTATLSTLPVNYYKGQQLLTPYPNPTSNELIVKCYFDVPDKGSMDLLNVQGKVVHHFSSNQNINEGYNTFSYSLPELPNGQYILRVCTSKQVLTQTVIVQQH